MAWLSITMEVDAAAAEALSEALMEAGADSVALDPSAGGMRVCALAGEGTDARALVAEAARLAALEAPAFETARLDDDDWVRRSQAQFGPLRISGRLWIVPTWREPPDPGALSIRLDPGLAFGTGSHPSTRLILQRLEALAPAARRVLDYGCGSGILAIVAARLGAKEVVAVDIDPLSVRATIENARANDAQVRASLPDGVSPAGDFELILANILAGPLVALAPELAAHARPGGRILLSGVLEAQAAGVASAYAADFEMSVPHVDEGWALLEGVRR